MVAITLAEVHQPPFLREYDSNATCACHEEAPGRSIEHCRALKRKVQAIGLFAQATCAPEFGLPRPFNQRLLILRVGGAAVKQQVKFKTNKFQNKKYSKKKFKKEKRSI